MVVVCYVPMLYEDLGQMGEIQVHEANKERHSQANEKIGSYWYRMSAYH